MQLWTYWHTITLLPAFAVMLLAGCILRHFLGDKPLQIRMIPLQIIAVFLVLLEIGKQALSVRQGYSLYHIPLHFCSLFIFMLPAMAFWRGKYAHHVSAVTASLCYSVLILMLIYPSLIYSDWDIQNFFHSYFAFHTVIFHNLVLFAAVLVIALRVHEPQAGERKVVLRFIVLYCIVASVMAQLLETNFNNFYSCNVPPLETVRIAAQGILGYGLTQLCYVLIVSVLDIGFVQGAYSVYRGLRMLFKPHGQKIAKIKAAAG